MGTGTLDLIRGNGSVAEMRANQKSSTGFRRKVNSHVHLPPNFSAFNTVEQVLDLADAQNVRVIGVTNYYDYQVYAQFADLARKARVFPLFGLEIISLIDKLAREKVKINDPGNPGRMYLCGKGVTRFEPVPRGAAEILDYIRVGDTRRMKEMVDKVSEIFRAADCDLGIVEPAIKKMIATRHGCREDVVYLQERHIAQAFQEALFAKLPVGQRAEALSRAYGVTAKASPQDPVAIQNEFRSNLLKAGKPAFVTEGFVNDVEAKKMILGMGGIPCYPTLADGANPICPYEETPETLIANIRGMGITMAEFIPIRNHPEVLSKYVKAMRAAGLAVVGGTEHNTLDLIPLEPACLKGAPVPEDVQAIFWEGACVIAAHQFLNAHGESGFVDESGKPATGYRSDDHRIAAFAELGAAVIQAGLGEN